MEDEFDPTLDDSGRMYFHTVCPHGHGTIQAFTPAEWRDGLSADSLEFECLYCRASWKPSMVQRAAILGEFSD